MIRRRGHIPLLLAAGAVLTYGDPWWHIVVASVLWAAAWFIYSPDGAE